MAKNNNTLVFNGLMQGMSWDQIKEAKDEIKRHQGEKQPTRKDILTDWIIGKDHMLQQQGNSYQFGGSYSTWLNQYKEAYPQDSYSWGELSKGKLEDSFSNGNGLNSALGIAGTAMDWTKGFLDSVNSIDNSAQLNDAKYIAGQQINFGDNASLMNAQNNLQYADTNTTATDVGGHSFGQSAMNVGKDIFSGATTGLNIGGPWGAVIGAAAGLAKGTVQEIINHNKAEEAARTANLISSIANDQINQRMGYASDKSQQLAVLNQLQNMAKNGGHLAQEGKLFKRVKNKIADAMQADLNYSDAPSAKAQTTIDKLRGYPTFTLGGGDFGGAGSFGYWNNIGISPETYWIMNTPLPGRTFSEAFAEAVKNNQNTFWFNNKLYNTKRASSKEEYLKNRTKAEYEEPLNLRTVYDKDWNIYQDSTRIEPYVGQIPIIEKNKSKGGKLKKSHKFANGGLLNNYFYGLEEVNSGGSHEENPNEGVVVSYAPDGLPNKVEEGETIHNDYVYSKRLEANEKVLKNNLLDEKYEGKSFADISKKLTEDRKKRPNDPISVRTNEENLNRLQGAQEELKLDNKTKEVKRFLGSLNNDQLNALQQEMMDEYEAYAEQLAQQQEQENQTYQEEQAAQEGMFGRGGHLKQGVYGSSYLEREPWYTEPTIVSTWSNPINMENKIFELSNPINQEPYGIYERNAEGEIKKSKDGKPIIKKEYKKPERSSSSSLAPLRFAEAFGSAGQYLSDVFGLTNQPDYSNARMYQRAIDNIGGVNFTPIGNYLTHTPIDTEYLTNQQMATAATRRNYNNVVGNYTLGLLNDYNTLNQIGATAIAARQQDQEQKNKVAEFNRTTNARNSEMSLDAQKQNAALRAQKAQEYKYLADMMTKERDINEAARAANYQNFMSNLAAIGREDFNSEQIRWMIEHGVFPVGAESYLTGLNI